MGLKNIIGDFRKWLDGEEAASFAPEPAPARREWEEFLVNVARDVETAMQREMFTPPGGPTYIPREYLVFLSKADDSQWQGDKRDGLQRGLFHVLSERARELVGDKEVQTKSFAIELRVDGTLEKGQFRVQPVWDSSAPKTEVKPRTKAPVALPSTEDEETIAAPVSEGTSTIVRPRAALFSIEFARNNEASETFACHKSTISIGRGAKDIQIDLRLDSDLEISRKHATIERQGEKFSIICEGRNSIEVAGRELPQGERKEFSVGDEIKIGIYRLKCLSPVQVSAAEPASASSSESDILET